MTPQTKKRIIDHYHVHGYQATVNYSPCFSVDSGEVIKILGKYLDNPKVKQRRYTSKEEEPMGKTEPYFKNENKYCSPDETSIKDFSRAELMSNEFPPDPERKSFHERLDGLKPYSP